MRFIQLRRPLAEIYSAALDRPLSDEDEATRQSDMDAIRGLIEEIDTDLTTDYWRVKVRTQRGALEGRGCPSPSMGEGRGEGVKSPSPSTDAPRYTGGKWGQTCAP